MVLGWHGVLQIVARLLRMIRMMKILGGDHNTKPHNDASMPPLILIASPTHHHLASPTHHCLASPTYHHLALPTYHHLALPTYHHLASPTHYHLTSPRYIKVLCRRFSDCPLAAKQHHAHHLTSQAHIAKHATSLHVFCLVTLFPLSSLNPAFLIISFLFQSFL